MEVANSMVALSADIRTIDSSIGGLGRCQFLPGATGSVATEDARFTLLRRALVDVDFWISDKLGRDNSIL